MNRVSTIAGIVSATFVAAAACDSGTGGELIDLAMSAENRPVGTSPLGTFTTDEGWEVVLTEARLAVSAVYVFAPDPDASTPMASLFLPSVARAHGGIDPLSGRRVRAERLGTIEFDLLSNSPLDLGVVTGEAGDVDAVEVRFGERTATVARGHHAYFAGVATRGAETHAFEGGIDVDDDGTARRVEGIAVDATFTDGGTFSLGFHAGTFFRGARFEDLPPEDAASGVSVLAVGSQPYEAIALGIRNPTAFEAAFAERTGP